MSKIVLDYLDGEVPKENDILIYDKKKERWKCVSREKFLCEQDKKIMELEEKCKVFEEKIKKLDDKIINLAKIMKEGI